MVNHEAELKKSALDFETKLRPIKVCLFDCDGILTDGKVYWAGEEVGFNRFFNVLDGYGMKLLMNAGLKVGVITGGNSVGVIKRFEELKIDFFYYGNEDKIHAYEEVLKKANVKDHEVLYMGDELFDIPLLKRVGFAATTPHACHEVKDACHYITKRNAGDAAAREVIEMLRFVQKI